MKNEEWDPAPSVNDELRRAIERALARGAVTSQSEVEAFAQRHIDGYNKRPQEELGGLSPAYAAALLYGPWESGPKGERPGPDGPPEPAVYLTNDLEPERVVGTPFFRWSYRFMGALVEANGVKGTARGNLPRKLVAQMLLMDIWPESYVADTKRYNKVINEEDHWWLHVTRVVAELAGTVKRRKAVFRVTPLGRRLTVGDERSGKLFTLLFQAHFIGLNLAYLDGCSEAPGFQGTIAYPLWRFGNAGQKWRTARELVPQLILPAVRDEIPLTPHGDGKWDEAPTLIERRLLVPLVMFGLAESRPSPRDDGPRSGSGRSARPRDEYRPTDLFGEFLQFCHEPGSQDLRVDG